jgi:hypothetical protein
VQTQAAPGCRGITVDAVGHPDLVVAGMSAVSRPRSPGSNRPPVLRCTELSVRICSFFLIWLGFDGEDR